MKYHGRPALLVLCFLVVGGVCFTGGSLGALTQQPQQTGGVSVTGIEAPVETAAGETITVSATVENAGTTPQDVTLEYRLDGDVLSTDTRTLAANETATVSFEVTIPSDTPAGTYTQGVFVAGGDSRQTSELIVTQPGEAVFAISGFQAPAQANTGQTITARATVENTGTQQGSTTLQYRIAGQVVATKEVTLDPGASVTVAIDTTVPSLSAGTYQQGLFVGDSNIGQTSTIVIGTPSAQFEVLSLQAPADARTGETLTATATVRNSGDVAGTQRFEYRVGKQVIDRVNIELGAGKQATVTFEGELPDVAAGTYQQGVFVGGSNSGLTGSLTVASPAASFAVTSFQGPSRVRTEDEARASVTLRNTGDARGSATLRYRIDGAVVDTETVTVDPGASRSVTFSGLAPTREPGTYQQGVFVDGTAERVTAPIVLQENPAAALRVSDLRAPSLAELDSNLTVTATIKNTGERRAESRIEYRIGTEVVASKRIDLRSGRSTTLQFDVAVPDVRRGTYTQGVFVGQTNRGQTTSLRLVERARFDVTNLQTQPSAVVGDRISVEATVRNPGETRTTRTVTYRIGQRRVVSQEVQLNAGQRRTITLQGTVPELAPGIYRQGVFVDGEGTTTRLEVRPRPTPRPAFSVTSFRGPSTVTGGGTAEATATVRNTGDASGTVTLEYRVDNRLVASRQVTLDAGGQEEITLRGQVPSLTTGSYQQGVFIAGTTQGRSGSVRLEAGQPRFTISNLRGPGSATVGEGITVRAEVTNTGTAPGETTIQYRLGSELTAEDSVALDPGANRTVEFAVTVPDIDGGTYTHGVFVGDGDRGQTTGLVVEETQTPPPTATPTPPGRNTPGFGVVTLVLALCVSLLFLKQSQQSGHGDET